MSTKEVILLESLKLFLEKGFTDVSVSDITEKSGIAKATFFHHFKNKETLLKAVFEKYFFPLLDKMNDEVRGMTGSVKDKIAFLFQSLRKNEKWFNHIIGDSSIEFQAFFFLLLEGIKKFQSFSDYYQKYQKKRNSLIHSLIEEGKNTGEFSDQLDQNFISGYIDIIFNGLLMSMVLNNSHNNNSVFDTCQKMIWRQLNEA
ncbi:MAG: TetR/AcrR family transcriptional regulator [Spirochaetes bacterium]|nr:TetR/AcrR family transcriptional regulator [Spirochaetota bacterium]